MKKWLKYLPIVFLVGVGVFAYRDFIWKPSYFWTPGDWLQYSFIEEFIRQSILQAKELPLWDPHQFSGMVFLAQPITKLFSITLPLILLAPETSLAIRLDWLFHFLVAGVGFYWLLRQFQVRHLVSLAGGIAYMLGGIFNNFPYNTSTFFLGFAWLPLVFGSFWLSLFEKKWKLAIIAGVFIAIQILSGQGPIVVYESLILALVSLYYLLVNIRGVSKLLSNLWLAIRNYLLTFGVGGLLSAVKLLPILEFSQYTDRGNIVLHYLEIIKTPFLGHLFDFTPSPESTLRFFIGLIWPALACLGILGLFHKKFWRLSLFLLFMMGFFYLTSMGSNLTRGWSEFYSPYELLWRYWPGFDSLFFPARLLGLVIFFGLILAGLGFNLLLNLLEKLTGKKWLVLILSLILIAATLSEYLNFTQKFTHLVERDFDRKEMLKDLSPWAKEFKENPFSFRTINLVDTELTSQYLVLKEGYQNAGGTSSAYFDFYLPYLAAGSRHGKFYTGGVEVWKEKSLKRLGELNVRYLITENKKDAQFGLQQISEWRDKRFAWENPFFQKRLWSPNYALFLVGENRASDFDVKKTLAVLNFIEESEDLPAVFYQKALPKGIPEGELILALDKSSEQLLSSNQHKVQALEFQSTRIPIELDNVDHNMEKERPGFILSQKSQNLFKELIKPVESPPKLDFQIMDFAINQVKFKIQTSSPNQPIVYAENNYPGWRAFLDDKEIPLFTVNGSLKGIIVEKPGEHQLEFKFISQSFRIGLLISLVSLMGLILIWLKLFKRN